MWIVVEDGDIFEGDELHWADCFFSNATETEIRIFCAKNGWKVEIQDKNETQRG